MIEIYNTEVIYSDNKVVDKKRKVFFYIELKNKLIILFDWALPGYYDRVKKLGYDIEPPIEKSESCTRNIFCYDKETGREIWQVESQEESPYVEVGVDFPGLAEDNIDCEQIRNENMVIGLIINQKIRKQIDRLEARTFDCNKYYIDIETGKVEWFGYTK